MLKHPLDREHELSNCCGVPVVHIGDGEATDICSACHEPCEVVKEYQSFNEYMDRDGTESILDIKNPEPEFTVVEFRNNGAIIDAIYYRTDHTKEQSVFITH